MGMEDINMNLPASWKINQVRAVISLTHKQLANFAKQNQLSFIHKGQELSEDQMLFELLQQQDNTLSNLIKDEQLVIYIKIENQVKENNSLLQEIQDIQKLQFFKNVQNSLNISNDQNNNGIYNLGIFNPKLKTEQLKLNKELEKEKINSTLNNMFKDLQEQQNKNNEKNGNNDQKESYDEDRGFFHLKMVLKLAAIFFIFSSYFKNYYYYLFIGVLLVYYRIKTNEFNAQLLKKQKERLKQEKEQIEERKKQQQQRQEQLQQELDQIKEQPQQDVNKNINNDENQTDLHQKQNQQNENLNNQTEMPLLSNQNDDKQQLEDRQDQKQEKEINLNQISQPVQDNIQQLNNNTKNEKQINDTDIDHILDRFQRQIEGDKFNKNINKKKKPTGFKLFILQVYELIYCYFISLFPTWKVDVHNQLSQGEDIDAQQPNDQDNQETSNNKQSDDKLQDKDQELNLDQLNQISLQLKQKSISLSQEYQTNKQENQDEQQLQNDNNIKISSTEKYKQEEEQQQQEKKLGSQQIVQDLVQELADSIVEKQNQDTQFQNNILDNHNNNVEDDTIDRQSCNSIDSYID